MWCLDNVHVHCCREGTSGITKKSSVILTGRRPVKLIMTEKPQAMARLVTRLRGRVHFCVTVYTQRTSEYRLYVNERNVLSVWLLNDEEWKAFKSKEENRPYF